MNGRRRLPLLTRTASIAIAIAVLAVWAPIGATAGAPSTVTLGTTLIPVVAPDVARSLIRRSGVVVRSGDGFIVEEVGVPRAMREVGTPSLVYRVRFTGRFAPRALPYVVTVDGAPLAVAVPSPSVRSVVALTADDVVTTGALELTYGGQPAAGETAARPLNPVSDQIVLLKTAFGRG